MRKGRARKREREETKSKKKPWKEIIESALIEL